MDATLEMVNGNPVLRFERRLAHPVGKVWKAISDPAQMSHWFPATVETELTVGAPMQFTFPGEAPIDGTYDSEILGIDPPRVYVFRWNTDVLRFELVPDGDGCRLYFSQTLGGGSIARLGAARNAAGWDHCLGSLRALLDGREAAAFTEWVPAMEHYIAVFSLDEGRLTETRDGYELRFARDLVWKPADDVWRLLAEDGTVEPGEPAPVRATNGYVPAGKVTAAEAPHLLEYEWEHAGQPAGEQVADSIRPLLLFETSLPTRYYLPFEDVRTDLLQASDTVSVCPYKGQARYWSLRVGHTAVPDVAWSYPNPIPENPKIRDLLCFSTSGSIWWSTANLSNAPYPRGQNPRQRSRRRTARLGSASAGKGHGSSDMDDRGQPDEM